MPDYNYDPNSAFTLKIDLNYISDPNAIIKYDPYWGGTYKGSYMSVTVDWIASTDKGLQGYNLYFGVHPLVKYKANKDGLLATPHLVMQLPVLPQNINFYFWATKIVNNVEIPLNVDGQTTYDTSKIETFSTNPVEPNPAFPETDNINDQLNLLLQRSLDDKKMALEMLGVKCDVYARRWGTQKPFGVPCTCTEDKQDPDFIGSSRCPLCFGTGIVGGYYPPIEMFIRFPLQPADDFKGTVRGLTLSQTYDGWTIIPPILREQDLIVRKIDGRRYTISGVQVTFFKGAATNQFFSLDLLSPTDIRHIVSMDTINSALAKLDDPRFNTPGRNSF